MLCHVSYACNIFHFFLIQENQTNPCKIHFMVYCQGGMLEAISEVGVTHFLKSMPSRQRFNVHAIAHIK